MQSLEPEGDEAQPLPTFRYYTVPTEENASPVYKSKIRPRLLFSKSSEQPPNPVGKK